MYYVVKRSSFLFLKKCSGSHRKLSIYERLHKLERVNVNEGKMKYRCLLSVNLIVTITFVSNKSISLIPHKCKERQ